MLAVSPMTAEVTIQTHNRDLTIASNTLVKLLWVARSHGWQAEKSLPEPATSVWDTELVGRSVGCYLDGAVSEPDAKALSKALKHILSFGDREMSRSMYMGLLLLLRVAAQGSFEVHPAAQRSEQRPLERARA
jgi:hypothetical protein